MRDIKESILRIDIIKHVSSQEENIESNIYFLTNIKMFK